MENFLKKAWRAKGYWLRVFFCWALAFSFSFLDEVKDYDVRMHLRGPQPAVKQIVLVYFDQDDWNEYQGQNRNLLHTVKDYSVITDAYFWNPRTWDFLLGTILQQNPLAIGVGFFFNDQLPRPDDNLHNLGDPRVFWAGQLDNEGRPALPVTANSYGYNVALVDLREDEDRILRRFYAPIAPLPHMGMKLSESVTGASLPEMNDLIGESKLINFRGLDDIYPSIRAIAILQGRVPPGFFKDKIVLIGSHDLPMHQYQTPLGRANRVEILAQIVDTILSKRWITRLSPPLIAIYLLLILVCIVSILGAYPQAVALAFLVWLALGTTALSAWVFDSFSFWIPALSPLLMCLVTYIVFLGYRLSIKENQTWRLEQERNLLSELDQLRNNFVSLISHDLKTPIAKIQAICDRLITTGVPEEVLIGLQNLRKESVELHRYIQSILQVSRLEASQTELRREATDLNELVEKVVEQILPLTRDKRQVLDVHLEPLFSIEVDGIMIQEVILNLIENAVKYTPNDGHIRIETQEVEDKVIFSVKDDGPGIPPEDQEHIFEKFYRGQQQKGLIKGTGLGLFLVKYFIELHGGEVFLESEVNKGTRVGFTLPLQS